MCIYSRSFFRSSVTFILMTKSNSRLLESSVINFELKVAQLILITRLRELMIFGSSVTYYGYKE